MENKNILKEFFGGNPAGAFDQFNALDFSDRQTFVTELCATDEIENYMKIKLFGFFLRYVENVHSQAAKRLTVKSQL